MGGRSITKEDGGLDVGDGGVRVQDVLGQQDLRPGSAGGAERWDKPGLRFARDRDAAKQDAPLPLCSKGGRERAESEEDGEDRDRRMIHRGLHVGPLARSRNGRGNCPTLPGCDGHLGLAQRAGRDDDGMMLDDADGNPVVTNLGVDIPEHRHLRAVR